MKLLAILAENPEITLKSHYMQITQRGMFLVGEAHIVLFTYDIF